MKHLSLLTLFFILFFINQGTAFSQDLSANIMRRVDAANLNLDKAEEQIRIGEAEHAPAKLKGAQKEYDNIFSYYKGSFDPNHPTLVKLVKRIEKITKALAKGTGQKPQNVATVTTKKAQQTNPAVTTNTPTTQKSVQGDLSANIRRRIDTADRQLVLVNQGAAKGDRDMGALNAAKAEYKNIFQYYKGSFDPNHPDIIALQKRIDAAEQAMNAGFAKKNATAPLESNSAAVEDLPKKTGEDLISIAGALRALENRLATAAKSGNPGSYVAGVKDDLQFASDKFIQFNSTFKGQFDPSHAAYIQVETRLKKDRDAVSKLEAKAGAVAQAKQKSQQSANDAKAQSIMTKYEEAEINSALYRKNPRSIVWSAKEISLAGQDNSILKKSFRLSDPIFGRLYLDHSLGNTPIYGSSGVPARNREFRYEFRLFIDGQEKVDRFQVFTTGKLNSKAGESWKTWQFAPNPIPHDAGFQNEADAWRRTTKGLSPGTYNVRFELWAAHGQARSRGPISVGEFSLIVKKGARISAGMKFPEEMYSGNDAAQLREQLKKALATGKISYSEIVKLAIAKDWAYNRYSDSKKEYRKISAAVLFTDKDNAGVCRFVTYNFISDKNGNGWTKPRFHSFCMGCPEGDVECP